MRTLSRLYSLCLAATLSSGALAVTLDFDGVCAAPPCPIGNQYPGFTFTPNNAHIAAAGADGLTGPVGGKYLSVPGLPIVISAPKNATNVSFLLSRANTSAGPMTVSVQPTKNGVPVLSPQFVQLDTINVWSANGFGVGSPIEIDGVRFAPTTADPFGIDDVVFDISCFGFSDVSPADTFCNAVEWLGNRNITLGCAANQYCPNSDVTRAQMALFLNRMGIALTPLVIQRDCAPTHTFSPLQRGCLSAHSPTHPRTATAKASCGVLNGGGASKSVASTLVYSTDGGFTWTPLGHAAYASLAAGGGASLANTGSVELTPGTPHSFGLEIAHHGGDVATSVAVDCTVVTTIHNRNPSASPF